MNNGGGWDNKDDGWNDNKRDEYWTTREKEGHPDVAPSLDIQDWGGVVQQASYTGVTKDDGELINSRATRRLRVRPLESGSDSSRTSARHRDTAHPHMRR